MVENRFEKRKARRIQEALDCSYTKALRLLRSFGDEKTFIDWDDATDEQLRAEFGNYT